MPRRAPPGQTCSATRCARSSPCRLLFPEYGEPSSSATSVSSRVASGEATHVRTIRDRYLCIGARRGLDQRGRRPASEWLAGRAATHRREAGPESCAAEGCRAQDASPSGALVPLQRWVYRGAAARPTASRGSVRSRTVGVACVTPGCGFPTSRRALCDAHQTPTPGCTTRNVATSI